MKQFIFCAVAAISIGVMAEITNTVKTTKIHQPCNYSGGVQLWENGPCWAECNIGASKPEEYGFYFWWGDTVGYIGASKPEEYGFYFWWGDTVGYKRVGDAWVASDGSSSNFSFSDSNTPTYAKSVDALRSEGWITSDGVLAPAHDAAHVKWGGNWRMPTKQDIDGLNRKCDWTWTTMNGVNGYVVRGRGDYASRSIFLPAAGYGHGTSLYDVGSYGDVWSSVPGSDNDDSWYLYFNSIYRITLNYYRCFGFSVRPVLGLTK